MLAKCFWPTFLMGAVYQLVYTLLQFASPQILGLIISFVQSEDPEWHGYFYTALFAVVALLSAIADSTYWYNMHLVGKYLYIIFRFGIKITYLFIYNFSIFCLKFICSEKATKCMNFIRWNIEPCIYKLCFFPHI